ncbi:MAG TPA: family 78 glycoside hydrolase catalytic domain [Puia sp.]|nr:family 78 glycoside hydrolase catalytic domain [Puia sp.]
MNRLLVLVVLLFSQTAFSQEIRLTHLRCDFRGGAGRPWLSWELQSSHHGVMQSGYQLVVFDENGTLWDSRKQESGVSTGIPYAGADLAAGRTYFWKVRVWDRGRWDSSKWSATDTFQTPLLTRDDWKGAQWIGYAELPDPALRIPGVTARLKKSGPARDTLPLFRKEFRITRPLRRATAFVCGLGQFELHVNGEKTGDHFLDPGWVDYAKKALYVPLDITTQLRQGENAIGVLLGNGFYYIPRERYHKLITAYGYPKLIARIRLEYADGTSEDIVTDGSWRTAPGPITYSSIYGGEDEDARREQPGWDRPGFAEKGWRPVLVVDGPPRLEEQQAAPLKIFEHLPPRRITRRSASSWLYDLGQNASGIIRLRVSGPAGAVVRITPGELTEGDSVNQKATGRPYYWQYTLGGERYGQPGRAPNGRASEKDSTAPGSANGDTWQPRFSYYGFRYLQLDGAVPEGRPNPDHLPVVSLLEGLHTRNAMERTGRFTCSNQLFRRIDTLIDWAIQSNAASVFTDCPHREKLGWLEEAHLMGNSLRFTYDIAALFRKIVGDMEDAQTPGGLVPEIAPEFTVFGEPFRDSPEWGSSSILLPWYLYQWYEDRATLGHAYPMMRRYADYLQRQSVGHLLYEGLGDWYDIGPKHPGISQLTPKGVTASAIYYYDLTILSQTAAILGHADESRLYALRADTVKRAFDSAFFDPATGEVAGGSQTANAMALFTGVAPDTARRRIFENIVSGLRGRHYSLTAGDIGYRYLLKTLDEGRRPDLIYEMNNRSDVPGYGYQLAKGATALTESWQALPSVSNDHLMLGHLMEWFYDGLGGLAVVGAHSVIRPEPVGDIQWAQADYHSPYGTIASHWKRSGGVFDLDVTIPANTMATVWLPAPKDAVLTEGWKAVALRSDVHLLRHDSGWAVFELGSGTYNFRSVTGNSVSADSMQAVYEKVKTPFKYGLVLTPPDRNKKMDCPTIFRKGNDWYMSYIIYDGRGYETWLAKSADLLHWKTEGRILSFSDTTGPDSNRWDANQKAGYLGLVDMDWGGSYRLEPWKGKYWMPYFGGNSRGYEAGVLSEGMAFTAGDPATAHEWQRLDHPILTTKDPDVAWWDNHTMYKSWLLHDAHRHTGHPFVLFYNANGDSLDRKRGSERIGMAVSDDLEHWTRTRRDPLLDHLTGITGDPYIQKIGRLYVMFYFGAFWKGTHGAFNRFACSYDLVHWTDWTGPDLIQPSEPYDDVFAHKSCVVNHKGIVYHFYCAVDKKGNRCIALATSKDLTTAGSGGRVNFDDDWQFHLGDDTARGAWRPVRLPHDWSIEGGFSPANATGQGEGGLPAGAGWYRKTFSFPGRAAHVFIDFDGVYRDSEVWLNGHLLGRRPNGYISFQYELTEWLNRNGDNTVFVRVDNSQQPNSRWYSGSGIYRHVWLERKPAVSIDHWGVHVTTPEVSDRMATVQVEATLRGASRVGCLVQETLYDSAGDVVGRVATPAGGTSGITVQQHIAVPFPRLWSPDHPYLYRLELSIYDGDSLVDRTNTAVGIRSFRFDVRQGFFLNGIPLKIRGVCLHHDLGALGAAVNTAAIRRQLRILKDMGCNAIRTSHNPPAPEFLDCCDRLGFIVMDEAFDMWEKKKTKHDYSADFREWHRRDLMDQVLRDRNHPSVMIWSIGNEIREQFDSSGIRIARELAGIVRSLDSTRPVTSALTETDTAKNFIYRSGALDLVGLNYHQQQYDSALRHYPGHALIATETTSALETRGHYDMPSDSIRRWPAGPKQPLTTGNADYTVSAYDNVSAYWGSTHEETWRAVKRDPWISGLFVWTGWDYLGEPTPYPWPARSSYFGIVDLAGFPKDVYYLYQSEWTTKPVLHLFPHWNWRRGEPIDVWAYYSQADEAELYLNGRSLGIRRKQGDDLHVQWRVPFEPGVLRVVTRRAGRVVLQQEVHTAGPPARIRLGADRTSLQADGSDLSFVTIRVTDAAGVTVPDAANDLQVSVSGPGALAGMDNGYQADLASFHGPHHHAYNGLCLAIVRTKKQAGRILIRVGGKGLLPATLALTSR